MKKLLFVVLAMLTVMPLFSQTSKPRTGSTSYDGYVKLLSSQLSYPLGRYVQFTSTSLPFKISSPDQRGNGTFTTTFTFEVLRHVPKLQYCTFKIEPVEWNDGGENFRIKFKKDQNAVEQLSEAIANKAVSKKTIKFTQSYSDMVAQEIARLRKAYSGQVVDVDYNSIYCTVPVANVNIEGGGNIRVKEAPTILLNSYENNRTTTAMSVNMSLLLDPNYSPNAYNMIVVRSDNGEFYKTFDNVSLSGYVVSENIYISGREMDVLLTRPIYIDIMIQ